MVRCTCSRRFQRIEPEEDLLKNWMFFFNFEKIRKQMNSVIDFW